MVTFLRLSGRICEVLTQSDWMLNVGRQLSDIPDLPAEEIHKLLLGLGKGTGNVPVTVPYRSGNPFAGYITIPRVLSGDVETGRAGMYSPPARLCQCHRPLDPLPQAGAGMPHIAAVDPDADVTHQASFQEGSALGLLQSVAAMVGDSSRIDEFLSSGGVSCDYGESGTDYYEPDPYDSQTRFEEDSAGWPGGAYQNPDSSYYEPHRGDD